MKIEVDHRADQLETMVLQCRSENHHWKRLGETVTDTTRKGIIREITVVRACPNCLVQRTDTYSLPRFSLVKRHYRYNADYRLTRKKGDARVSKEQFRAAYLARELKELLR